MDPSGLIGEVALSIGIIDNEKGVGVSKNENLGFFVDVDDKEAHFGFKVTMKAADANAMKTTKIKQEIFFVSKATYDVKGKLTSKYFLRDKDHPATKVVTEEEGIKALQGWLKDGSPDLVTPDINTAMGWQIIGLVRRMT